MFYPILGLLISILQITFHVSSYVFFRVAKKRIMKSYFLYHFYMQTKIGVKVWYIDLWLFGQGLLDALVFITPNIFYL